jgi:UTP--glucose-1-phosphate uridylyltransferase
MPSTRAQPKHMLSVDDKPVVQYGVEKALSFGIKDILITTGRNKRAVEDHFNGGTIETGA